MMTIPAKPGAAARPVCLELPDRVRVHCLTSGHVGSPVVLLHGGGIDAASFSWKYAIGALADAGHRVFVPDWPGYGDGDRLGTDSTIDYFVRLLSQILDALELPQAALIGLSLGGAAALGLALRHPERILGLVLVDADGLGADVPGGHLGYLAVHIPGAGAAGYTLQRHSRWMVRQALAALVGDPSALSEDTVEEAYDLIRRPGAGRAFHTTQAGQVGWGRLRTDDAEQLPDLAVPTLIIHGEADPVVPVAWARRAQQRIPGARLVTLPGVGHLSPREAPDAVNTAIRDFLTSIDRTRSRKAADGTEHQR